MWFLHGSTLISCLKQQPKFGGQLEDGCVNEVGDRYKPPMIRHEGFRSQSFFGRALKSERISGA